MNNNYVIQWKSKVNGRAGRGTKQFTLEEAERLVAELNREYPQIEHEAIPAPPPTAASEPEPALAQNEAEDLEEETEDAAPHRRQVFTTE